MRVLILVLMILGASCGKKETTNVTQCEQKPLYGVVWSNVVEDVAFIIGDEEIGAAVQISNNSIGCTWIGFPLVLGNETSGVIDITNAIDSAEVGCSLITENITYSLKCSTLTLCDSDGCANYTEL